MSRALTLVEAAGELRVSKRWLEYWLAEHPVDAAGNPFYVPMGRRKTFEDADISRIRAHIEAAHKRPPAPKPLPDATAQQIADWVSDHRSESAIYFIAVRDFIKIGWTTDWRKRMAQLQTANPDPITVLLVIGRPHAYEKTMHKHFAEHRTRGEWFKDCPEIREHIENLEHECWYRAGRKK